MTPLPPIRSLCRAILSPVALPLLCLIPASVSAELVINEIFYDPPGNTRSEFVELFNPTDGAVDVSGWGFSKGIDYVFPVGTSVDAGGYLVVAMDPAVFFSHFGSTALGPFGGRLAGEGETVELSDAAGNVVDEVTYRAEFPWPISATADGASMELIHPSLDNDLGGSWRGSVSDEGVAQITFIGQGSTGWSYRKGTSEASAPVQAWREVGFAEDGSWSPAEFPIGYGVVNGVSPFATELPDMNGSYSSVFARKTFEVAPGALPTELTLRFTADDGIVVWINGTEVARRNMNGNPGSAVSHADTAGSNGSEGLWYDVEISNAATLLVEGTNVVAVQGFNRSLGGSSDFGMDLSLIRPAGETLVRPTPGLRNLVFSESAPPQIRQVGHSPEQPASGEAVTVTAKVTDPDGVASVDLLYQVVAPGSFIPSRFPRSVAEVLADPDGERPVNPAFEDPANWVTVSMRDDGTGGDAVAGDAVFTAVVPGRPHRTLMRYRILAEDSAGGSVRVPYPDDPSLNFAYFVYNGVPDYVASTRSVSSEGAGKVWPKEMLTSLPVYHWIIRNEDMMSLQAYDSSQQFTNRGTDAELRARRSEEWEGAFVYDGVVYDHVRTRLRGGNSRYGDFDGRFPNGKRHYKFKFNDGHLLQARDQSGRKYPEKWKSLALNRMFGTKGGNGWGLSEEIGARLWRTFGVPAQNTHWIHFRVVDGASEAPDQYRGDFWGLTQAVEEYDGSYLEARGMTKGNLYKMSDFIWDAERQRRYRSPDMVDDGSEFNNIRDNLHGGQTGEWLNRYVDYDHWYRYSAVVQAIRHYDTFPYTDDIRHALKNLAWYFEPVGADPTRGVCVFLPYDWDASFGPNFNNGWDHANNALYGWDSSTTDGMPYVDKPDMKLEHRNVLREFRDLVWQEDQIYGLMDDRAAVIAEFSQADQDRWRNAPVSEGTANDDSLSFKLQDMKNFCFVGWNGGSGPAVGSGGRAAFLTSLADGPDTSTLPSKPVISYSGVAGHPIDGLAFRTTAFADPQGPGTFGAISWRIGEIEDPSAPGYDPDAEFIMEYTPVWESGVLESFADSVSVPAGALRPGHTYRARVRMRDSSGRWSHWSEPYQFTAAEPDVLDELKANLMVSEIMYHPAGPAPAGGVADDLEYIELLNISGSLTIDLTELRFTKGVDFDFAGSAVTSLPPGGRVLVVKDATAFESEYGKGLPVAGAWDADDNLANSGEQLKLSYGSGVAVHDFVYDDEAPWPVEADGNGAALQLVDPASAPDHGLAASWTAGTPSPGTGGLSDFEIWLADRGVEDPDAEAIPGMNHLLIYALGADLLDDPRTALPVAAFSEGEGGTRLALSFRRRSGLSELEYLVETSTTLGDWSSDPAHVELVGSPVDNGDGTETVTVRVLAPVGEDPVRFVRLRVELGD